MIMANAQRTIEIRQLMPVTPDNFVPYTPIILQAVVSPPRAGDVITWVGQITSGSRGFNLGTYNGDILILKRGTVSDPQTVTLSAVKAKCGDLEATIASLASTIVFGGISGTAVCSTDNFTTLAVGGGKCLILSNIAAEGLPHAA